MARQTSKKKIKSARPFLRDPVKLFIGAISASALLYFIIYIIIGNGRFAEMFFLSCNDFFMDFFNSIRDAAQGSEVYTQRGVIYPPMANLIFLVLSRFTPHSYNSTVFSDRYEWSEYFSMAMLAVLFCTAVALIFFYLVYSRIEGRSKNIRFAFAFFAFFSLPVLFMLERGNMIVFCLLALMVYAFSYNSEHKLHREVGLIALAFAFSLKLYPVVFGWFLIADKRWKDAVKCTIYGVLMLIIPSFFFGGPSCLAYVFLNIFNFSSGSGNTFSTILNYVKIPAVGQTVITLAAYAWILICGICFAISPFIKMERWKTFVLGFITILCIPSLTAVYNWAFFIIPIIMICNKAEYKRSDMAYMLIMTVPFLFIPFRFNYHVSPSMVLIYIMTAAVSIYAVFDTVKSLVKYRKQKSK